MGSVPLGFRKPYGDAVQLECINASTDLFAPALGQCAEWTPVFYLAPAGSPLTSVTLWLS